MGLFDALRVGQSLPNPIRWKWAGIAAGLLGYLISALTIWGVQRGWFAAELPPDVAVAGILSILGSVATVFGQVATTDKIGILPAKEDPADEH